MRAVGGPVPLGYRSVGKKLETVPEEAALVRKIFGDYLRLGSIGALAASLESENVRPKPRMLANATTIAKRAMDRGNRVRVVLLAPSKVVAGATNGPGQSSRHSRDDGPLRRR